MLWRVFMSKVIESLIARAKPVKIEAGSKPVKLGRAKTRVAGSRGFLRVAATRDLSHPEPTIFVKEIYHADEELRTKLSTWKSVGDAMGGDPTHRNPDSRGLGMLRRLGGRDFKLDDQNVGLAVGCLRAAGYTDAAIAALAGKTVGEFEEWASALPVRPPEPVLAPVKETTVEDVAEVVAEALAKDDGPALPDDE
jgi:hypothetical protein